MKTVKKNVRTLNKQLNGKTIKNCKKTVKTQKS